MICSNIHRETDGTFPSNSRFYKAANNSREYAQLAESVFSPDSEYEGRDHFTHTMRKIDKLWCEYSRSFDVEAAERAVNSDPAVKRWFAAVVCMAICGASDGYRLDLSFYSSKNRSFLDVWRSRFIADGKNDNEPECADKQPDAGAGLWVYELARNRTVIPLGCYSDRYCVIPARDFFEHGGKCENLFNAVMLSPNLRYFVEKELSAENRIKLKFSALSLSSDKPSKIVRDVLLSMLDIDVQYSEDIPCQTTGGFKVYACSTAVGKALLSEIYLTQAGGKIAALYPLRNDFIDAAEKKAAFFQNLKMTVSDEGKEPVVKVSGDFCCRITFVGNGADGEKAVVTYRFKESAVYKKDAIFSADNMGTLCTYPDLSLENEHRCSRYTYFYDLSSNVSGSGEAANLELEGAAYKTAYNSDKLYVFASSKPIHFIKVSMRKNGYSRKNRYAGCIVNMRKMDCECTAPLLIRGESVDVDLESPRLPARYTMKIFVDLGSSSSTIGYKIDNGKLLTDDVTCETPVVRELLGKYDLQRYSCFLNLPSLYVKRSSFPTSVVKFAEESFNTYRFDNMLIPLTLSFLEYEKRGMIIESIDKSELAVRGKQASDGLTFAIEGLCYLAVFHMIESGCEKAVFVQSFPNDEYKLQYSTLTKQYFSYLKENVFPDAELVTLIDCDNSHLLYESLAVSNGIENLPENSLMVSVDIGDSTTDLAAVYLNQGRKTVCGYSSIAYAGKQLLKSAVKNLVLRAETPNGNSDKAVALLGRIFFSKDRDSESMKSRFISLVNRIVKDNRRSTSAWENIFIEVLENADLDITLCTAHFKAELLMRYIALLPVIRDFIETAINACNADENVSVNVCFCGGGSKGFQLLEAAFGDLCSKTEYYLGINGRRASAVFSGSDSKLQLIRGLEKLHIVNDNGIYNVLLPDALNMKADWKYLDPMYSDSFISEKRQIMCAKHNIVPLKSSSSDVNYNQTQRRSFSNFFKGDGSEDAVNYMQELVDLFAPDCAENTLIKALISKERDTPLMGNYDSTNENGDSDEHTSFMKAALSQIYVEMIENASLLFETDHLLSDRNW